jgi:hypothetical protein
VAIRALLFALAFIAAYSWRAATRTRRSNQHLGVDGPLFFVLGVALILLSIQEGISWASFERVSWLRRVPLDAVACGVVLGMVMGDVTRPVGRAGMGPLAAASSASDQKQESWFSGLAHAVKGLAIGLPMATLVVMALVPPSTWSLLLERVEKVQAGNFSLSLISQQSAGRVVLSAASPQTSGRNEASAIGFVDSRLGQLQDLTYPAGFAETNSRRFLDPQVLDNVTHARLLIRRQGTIRDPFRFMEAGKYSLSVNPTSHAIQRDIAFVRMTSDGGRDSAERLEQLRKFGIEQQRVLIQLRPFVACLSAVVETTGDRNVVDFANFPNLEAIVSRVLSLATAWANLERVQHATLGAATPRALVADTERSRLETLVGVVDQHQAALLTSTHAFAGWAQKTLHSGRAIRPNENDALRQSAACAPAPFFPSPPRPEGGDLPAPYVALFAAHLLSAIGYHQLAVSTLVDWLEHFSRMTAQRAEKGFADDPQLLTWIRFRVLSHIWTVQRLSEGADQEVPIRLPLLRHLVMLHQQLLDREELSRWHGQSQHTCHREDDDWRQVLILSYFYMLKEYLDFLNISPGAASQVKQRDFEDARMLASVNVRCFSQDNLTRSREDQTAQFVLTFVATGLTWVTSEGMEPDKRASFVTEARLRLRDAVRGLQAAVQEPSEREVSFVRRLVAGQPAQTTLEAAEALQIRLAGVAQSR